MNKQVQITTICNLLDAWSDAYYNGTPLVSDAVYDAKEDELRKLDPNHPRLSKVGAKVIKSSGWQKAKHTRPMASLNKAQEESDLRSWAASCGFRPGELLVVMEKLDGASLNVEFRDGRFIRAITRGDGDVGEDITTNAQQMPFPKAIPGKWSGSLRGEVIVRYQAFKDHFPGQSNPRNTANGTMKRQTDASGCAYLDVVMFDVMPEDGDQDSKSDQFTQLATWGFSVPRWQVLNNIDDVMSLYTDYPTTIRSSVVDFKPGDGKLDYDIDGLVIQFDDPQRFEGLGLQGRGPKGAVALKFSHEEKPTILRNIRWQVGNSGRVTPVADFDEVVLAGAKVKQASLHNISNIERLAGEAGQSVLAVGDEILACRRNDVIPQIEQLLNPTEDENAQILEVPTECPECGTKLERDGEYLVCRGDNCDAQITGAIKRWVKKIGVLHFGESLIETLVASGDVEDAADLYTLDPKVVANMTMGQRRVGGTAAKAFKNLHAAKELEIHVFIGSLGIPMIGRSMAQTIIDGGFDSLDKMSKATPTQIAAIPGVGQTKALNFCKGFWDRMWLIAKLLGAGVTIKKQIIGRFTGKAACVTGFRGKDEAAIIAAFTAEGGTMKSGVSRKVNYLICKDATSTSGKPSKARKLTASGKANIEIHDIDSFWVRVIQKPKP